MLINLRLRYLKNSKKKNDDTILPFSIPSLGSD